MVPQWQKAIVTRIEQATYNTRRYWIALPETLSFDFKAGQFVTFDLPIHEQKNKRWRSYSIASAPDGSNVIELVIVHLEGGAGTTYFFEEVKEGSELVIRGPQGVFVLPEILEHDLYMICTGTGVAPFRSMVHYIKHHHIPHQQIHLIYGTRKHEDVLYEDELRALEKEFPSFHYHITLSRENIEGYEHGYVHAIYERLAKGNPTADFMLCGWREMIDDAKHRLADMGYDRKHIHMELYG